MPIAYIFWGLMFLYLFFGVAGSWPNPAAAQSRWQYIGPAGGLVLFLLLGLLGYAVFGSAVK